MAKKPKRLYKMGDTALLTRAQTEKDAIEKAQLVYTARFPWLDAEYMAAYQTQIDDAAGFSQNDVVRADIKSLKGDVKTCMAEGKNALDILFRYSGLAYPHDKKRQAALGKNRLPKARSNALKMINLLHQAWSLADKDSCKTDLVNKGYTQAQIDGLLVTSNIINNKNNILQNAKTSRPVATDHRIELHNTVFNQMRMLANCTRIVNLDQKKREYENMKIPLSRMHRLC